MLRNGGNGLELLCRLQERIGLKGLDTFLFPDGGPMSREVIELSGGPGTGKSAILVDLIMKCILPTDFQDICLSGFEAEVVYINMNQNGGILNALLPALKSHIETHIFGGVDNVDMEVTEEIVLESLNRFHLINVHSEASLRTTLIHLKEFLCSNTAVSLVAVDGLDTFYWERVSSGTTVRMDSYISDLRHLLSCTIGMFNVTVIYTKPEHFQSPFHPSGPLNISHRRICLSIEERADGEPIRTAQVDYCGNSFVLIYKISQHTIDWYD